MTEETIKQGYWWARRKNESKDNTPEVVYAGTPSDKWDVRIIDVEVNAIGTDKTTTGPDWEFLQYIEHWDKR